MASEIIILVDDEFHVREPLASILEEEGFTVMEAADGIEALERLKQCRSVSLILLDLMMPRMDGWEFLRNKNADPSFARIPVILMTAAPQNAPRDLPVINKPSHPQEIIQQVRLRLSRKWNESGGAAYAPSFLAARSQSDIRKVFTNLQNTIDIIADDSVSLDVALQDALTILRNSGVFTAAAATIYDADGNAIGRILLQYALDKPRALGILAASKITVRQV
jgi:CheY-like chemotaxis protein